MIYRKPFIIAEVGVNHNGSLGMALKMISEAKKCGAHCIKFQTFHAEDVVVHNAEKAKYQLRNTNPSESQMDMLRKLELPEHAWPRIIEACNQEGVMFLSTPYGKKDADLLLHLNVEAFKIASGQIVEPHFLGYVASTGKPLIVSTGMATLAEVDQAVNVIEKAKPRNSYPKGALPPLSLLQCTTNYPAPIEDANLASIPLMANVFGLPVGYSDHTEDEIASIVAVSLGAHIIEKHFTLDHALPGPDQSSSADPIQFKRLVTSIDQARQCLGKGQKRPSQRELDNAFSMRRGIVAARDLPAGTTLKTDDVAFKRPLKGIPAAGLGMLLGRRLSRSVAKDTFLDIGMFTEHEDA